MPDRRDFLAVCNDQGVPLKDFQQTFCVRCVQPECSRSRSGGLFETRVTTWQERLLNPPRMAKDDPLYMALAAKRFIEVDTGPIPEVRGPAEWIDPRAIPDEPAPAERPRPAKPSPASVAQPSAPAAPPPVGPRAPLNTPFVQGRMLEGAPAAAVAPKPDRWAAAPAAQPSTPEASGAPIVKAGAKIKFTGG